jgi:hypothetical protein
MHFEKKIRSLTFLRDEILQIIERNDVIIQKAHQNNPWFIPEFIKNALQSVAYMLEEAKLIRWLSRYSAADTALKNIGLVLAGNIPLVGFHDLLCVLLSGHRAILKLSHNDEILIPYIMSIFEKIEPEIKEQIMIEASIHQVDAAVATGSDNTSRYFKHAFKNIPYIIRNNRTSCGILDGSESSHDLEALSEDVFQYFGLGCRNVSKIYVPKSFDIRALISKLGKFSWIINHSKYYNNYKLQITKNLLEGRVFIDGQFFILSKSSNLVSPVSCIFYEEYDSLEMLKYVIGMNKNKLQCIVSKNGWYENSISFGMAQHPEPWDYADQIDTMEFLLDI